MQGSCNDAHSLELRSRIADSFLIDCECLRKELISHFFEAGLVGYLTTSDKKAETEIGCAIAGVEGGDG